MEYKFLSSTDRSEIVNELFNSDDINYLYYPNWLKDVLGCNDIDEVPPLLGSIHSPKIKTKILLDNLYKLTILIHKFDISKLILDEDIERLITFSQDLKYQKIGVSDLANSIIAILFVYPPNISNKLFVAGIFDKMIADFLEPYWMNGLAYYCHYSVENRNEVFETFQIPQRLCECIASDETQQKYFSILNDIAIFTHSLCTFPLSDHSQFQIISDLISFLVNSIRNARIETQNSILAALTVYSILDDECMNDFAKYNIFQYFSESDSYHPQNIVILAKLMTAVMNFSFDYAAFLAQNNDCWKIVLRFFENLVNLNSDLYKKGCMIIADAAIIMANASPDSFIQNKIYLQLIEIHEKLPFSVKHQFFMIFYAAFQNATISQIEELIQNDDYIFILSNYFPDIDNSKFIMGANGFLNLLNYLETSEKEDIIFEIIKSDEFDSNYTKWFEDQQALTDVSEEMKGIISLIQSKVSHYKEQL